MNANRTILWTWLPFLLIFVNIAAVAWYYDRIPDIIPLHYDAVGHVDRVGPKSFGTIFMPNILQLFIALVLAGVRQAIAVDKRRRDPADPEASGSRKAAYRRENIRLIQWLSLTITVIFSLIQWAIVSAKEPTWIIPVVILLPVAVIAVFIVRIVRLGRSGGKHGISGSDPSGEDRYWKGGLIYMNPDDPSLFVEKRIGLGYTVNLGRPLGWVVLLSPFILVAAIFLIIEFGSR